MQLNADKALEQYWSDLQWLFVYARRLHKLNQRLAESASQVLFCWTYNTRSQNSRQMRQVLG